MWKETAPREGGRVDVMEKFRFFIMGLFSIPVMAFIKAI